jgi:NADH dehydrogenase
MILVTGSTGFAGRSLMRVLEQENQPAQVYGGRINDPAALREALDGVRTVIHLAGAEARDRVRLLHHVDVEGTERLLEEMHRAGASRLVVLSRLNAEPASMHALLRVKGQVERLVRQSGIPYVILRSATLFGREDRFLNVITGLAYWTWPTVWLPGGGHVAMQPLWVEDLARCLAAAAQRDDLLGKTIEVAGDERLRYREITHLALRTAGLSRFELAVTPKLVRPLSAIFFGWWRRPPVTRFFMDRFSVPEVAATDAVYEQFGFRPGRLGQHTSYLRGLDRRRRLFRLPETGRPS